MATRDQNDTLIAGDSAELAFVIYDEDGVTPLDLSGATVVWQMWRFRGDPAGATIEKTPVGNADGTFFVTILPADTIDLGQGRYPHGARVMDIYGNILTVTMGFIVIEAAAVVVA